MQSLTSLPSDARDGYLSGLIVGISLARLSPHIADRVAREIVSLIADAYKADPQDIRSRVDDDAQAIINASLLDMSSERACESRNERRAS